MSGSLRRFVRGSADPGPADGDAAKGGVAEGGAAGGQSPATGGKGVAEVGAAGGQSPRMSRSAKVRHGGLPSGAELESLLHDTLECLANESEILRPGDSRGKPGGLICLPDLPTILMPDLHACPECVDSILAWRPGDSVPGPSYSESVEDLLEKGEISLVFLGDGINTEGPEAARRWRNALEEYFGAWSSRRSMDEEMALALDAMVSVMRLKLRYPGQFHFLKGNHDNLADRVDSGDRHFFKYAAESAMGASWFLHVYGANLLELWRSFELALPLVVAGRSFAASHAEPAFALDRAMVIESAGRPDVIHALIWTDNDEAAPGSVLASLASIAPDAVAGFETRWYGGHRRVRDLYAIRAAGRYVQIHGPAPLQAALIHPYRPADPEHCVVRVPVVRH